ncbi:type VII secretion system-associated protein [Streptomyces sp. PTM05]|uniref:Type VII secretion system-associated protein n=1 Tax=Streptantibioticus parmotrematis TaxID=2873249 RepID=A0ABS7QS95_9ACTN|nr:type VII secretion system-associated protein [Streptantibioticus parmotrematis]MBY8886062.1 type VII secretion system-associated protein [Streptantibioticus parmotrematis]
MSGTPDGGRPEREPVAQPGPRAGETAEAEEPRPPVGPGSQDLAESPPVPDHIREAARRAPDHWFGMVDPTWSGEGAPPDWAVVGQWRSDSAGEIVEWRDNEEYQPSPKALEWDDPTDPVDAAVQLAATGYGPAEAVTRALADAEVAVFLAPGGGLLSAVAPDDSTPVVPVFTSPAHLHAAGRLSFVTMKAVDLLDRLPEGHLVYLNPSGSVSMAVDSTPLREALTTGGEPDGGSAWSGDLDEILPLQPAEEGGDATGGAMAHPLDGEHP